MKAILKRINRSPSPQGHLVTVCWLENSVSFMRWYGPPDGNPVPVGFSHLPGADCDGETYRRILSDLVPFLRSNRPAVHWIILNDPGIQMENPDQLPTRLPAWMRDCWESLPMKELPAELFSGLARLEHQLKRPETILQTGHGVFFTLGERACFFAWGEGKMFRRISRLANSAAHQLPVLDSEWMQQTRMLFNNRTGLELKKVYVPQLDTMDGTLEIEGIEVSHEYRPHGWPEEIGEWSGLKFLHACALGDHPEEASLHHPIIERCRTVRHWKSAFRTATVLLFAGWALFLQGACRHDAPEGIMDTGQPQLSKEAIEFWEASDKKWRQLSRRRQATARPFELIGMVVASAPPGIDLDRIHLSRPDGDAKNLSLVMEGSCLSGEGPAEFRQWMGHLRETTPLGRVENLKFDRQSGTLRFHLVGQTVSREGFE